jgi:hypothetical protein
MCGVWASGPLFIVDVSETTCTMYSRNEYQVLGGGFPENWFLNFDAGCA